MARLASCGFEWNSLLDLSTGADGDIDAAGGALVTSGSQRSGTYAWRGSTTSHYASKQISALIPSAQRDYWSCQHFLFEALPDSTCAFGDFGNGAFTVGAEFRLTSGGKLQLFGASTNTQVGSDSAKTLTTGVWYCVECRLRVNASRVVTELELRLDGETVASGTGLSEGTLSGGFYIQGGWSAAPGSNKFIRYDDIAVNDDQGSAQNTWIGTMKQVLLVPTADSQRGSWTGGAGGTTNLWEAINNRPPVGTASETDTTQIENADNSPDNSTDEYRATMTTYSAAGVVSDDTIRVLELHLAHGEDAATGTKTGKAQLFSNPAEGASYSTNWTFGDDLGALGTFPSNWRTAYGRLYSPSVTLGTAPVVALRKVTTSTQPCSVCSLGVLVEYTHKVVVALGQASETDEAFAITAVLSGGAIEVTVNQVAETDAAQPVAWAPKHRLAAQVTETELAQPVTARRTYTLGQATEVDLAQALTSRKAKALGQASETDEGQALNRAKAKAIGQALEADEAFVVTPATVITVELGQAAESDAAQAVAAAKVKGAGQASETDAAGAVTARKTATLGQASETDEAQPVTVAEPGEQIVPIGQAAETDAAQAVSARKTAAVGQVSETDLAQSVTARCSYALGQTSETDSAHAMTAVRTRVLTVGQAVELDEAQAVAHLKALTVGMVTETDLAQLIEPLFGERIVLRFKSSPGGRTGSDPAGAVLTGGPGRRTSSTPRAARYGSSPGGRVTSDPEPH